MFKLCKVYHLFRLGLLTDCNYLQPPCLGEPRSDLKFSGLLSNPSHSILLAHCCAILFRHLITQPLSLHLHILYLISPYMSLHSSSSSSSIPPPPRTSPPVANQRHNTLLYFFLLHSKVMLRHGALPSVKQNKQIIFTKGYSSL